MKTTTRVKDSRFEIINGKRILRDGQRLKIRTTLMDAERRTAARARGLMPLTDGNGRGGLSLQRPGFRTVLSAGDGRAARQKAYDAYHDELENAWRGSATADGEGYSEANLGMSCTVQGEAYPLDYGSPGTIKRVEGKICCVPDNPVGAADAKSKSEEEEDLDEEEDEDNDDQPGKLRVDNRTQNQVMRDHQENMARVYAEHDRELTETWRRS